MSNFNFPSMSFIFSSITGDPKINSEAAYINGQSGFSVDSVCAKMNAIGAAGNITIV